MNTETCIGRAPEHLRRHGWYLGHQAWLREKGEPHHDPEGMAAEQFLTHNRYTWRGPSINLQGAILREIVAHSDFTNANLSDADLTRADLGSSCLITANLSRANLSHADLEGANCYIANLREANLYNAVLGTNLCGADLTGARHIVRLPIGDPRGHEAFAVYGDTGWLIYSFQREESLDEAREYWENYHIEPRMVAEMYVHALDWLESNEAQLLEMWGD